MFVLENETEDDVWCHHDPLPSCRFCPGPSSAPTDSRGPAVGRVTFTALCVCAIHSLTALSLTSQWNKYLSGCEPPRGLDSLWIKIVFRVQVDVEFSTHSLHLKVACVNCVFTLHVEWQSHSDLTNTKIFPYLSLRSMLLVIPYINYGKDKRGKQLFLDVVRCVRCLLVADMTSLSPAFKTVTDQSERLLFFERKSTKVLCVFDHFCKTVKKRCDPERRISCYFEPRHDFFKEQIYFYGTLYSPDCTNK